MKLNLSPQCLGLVLTLTHGFFAAAQSSNAPVTLDYAGISRFIAQRNIFDPNRTPQYSRSSPQTSIRPTRTQRSAPAFTLVGTMSYEKGMFAFFDGNNSDLRKVLYRSDTNGIAGFTLADLTLNSATLQSADKKRTVTLKIGEMMRQEGTAWQTVGQGELASGSGDEAATAPAAENSHNGAGSTAAPSPALEANDILKKLMQKRREQE